MARGRMLNKTISLDPEVAELVNELGGLAGMFYTWTIAHLDRDGRISGNPKVLVAGVTPLIAGVTPELVRSTLERAHTLKLIEVYDAEGKTWVSFPKFQKNQQGMRYDREAAGVAPTPSGVTPEWIRQLPAESKAKECNVTQSNSNDPGSPKDRSVCVVANYYREKNPGKGRCLKPGHKDWQRITTLIDGGFSIADLCLAVDGNLIDRWHVDNRKHSAEFVFRNATKVEGFIDTARRGNPTGSDSPRDGMARATQAFLESEEGNEYQLSTVRGVHESTTRLLPERNED